MYDCIVLGVGGFGSGALYHAAKRGARVLGLEQFGVAHDLGSSHGETRIIRKAYFEHPDYVPLLERAYELWSELEAAVDRPLFHRVGLFLAGLPDAEAVAGTLHASRLHGLEVERLTAADAQARFPGYRFPPEFEAVFERQAGYLDVEQCVAAHCAEAVRHGAELRTGECVVGWNAVPGGVHVQTDRGSYEAATLIVTAGPWAGQVLAELGLPLQVVRKPMFWFNAPASLYSPAAGNSMFFFQIPQGQFYGFPCLDGNTIKIAEHTSGDPVADPSRVYRGQQPMDLQRVTEFLAEYMPSVVRSVVRHSVCMYTRTPDLNFVVDRHPQHPQVVPGAGFSGHGFKFTGVLGQALAELALAGKTSLPIGFLSLDRPALQASDST